MVRSVPVILLVSTFGCPSVPVILLVSTFGCQSVPVILLVSTFGCQSKCACDFAGQYFWLSV